MNKTGIGYVTISTMEYAFLIILAVFLSVIVFNGGLEEQKLNQLKADNLVLTLDSVFLLEGDVFVKEDLGGKHNVNEEIRRIRIYDTSEIKTGISYLAIPSNFEFAENVRSKKDILSISKKGNNVVVS